MMEKKSLLYDNFDTAYETSVFVFNAVIIFICSYFVCFMDTRLF